MKRVIVFRLKKGINMLVKFREIPVNTKDSPAKQEPTKLLKETNSTPSKLQPSTEPKYAPDTTKKFFRTEKKVFYYLKTLLE